MKANKKSTGIKHLFFAHVEKVLALVIVGLGAYLVYASLSVEGESRQASELRSAIGQTRTAFQNSSWESIPEEIASEHKFEAYDPGSGAIEKIPHDVYPVEQLGARPVVPPTVDRTDPELLPAIDLEGSALTGLMAFVDEKIRDRRLEELRRQQEEEKAREEERQNRRDDPLARGRGGGRGDGGFSPYGGRGGEDMKGKRPAPRVNAKGYSPQGDELIETVSCAVVLAKAPSLDQYNVYKSELEEARGYSPTRDVPKYLGFLVERAEVRDGEQLEWEPVKLTDGRGRYAKSGVTDSTLDGAIKEWAGSGDPIVDSDYEHYIMTMPLPPLVGQEFGHSAVHSEAPLQVETEAKLLEEQEGADELEPEPGEGGADDDIFASGADDTRGGRGLRGGRTGGISSRRSPRMGGFGGEMGMGDMGMGDMGMGMGEMGMGGMGMGMGMGMGFGGRSGGSARRSSQTAFDPELPFYMLRFFDFTVAPGRQYRYRLRLVLEDVNQASGVVKRHLDRQVVDRISKEGSKPYRLAEWSEPSPIISVPMAGDVFIASVKPAGKGANSEGSVELLVQSYSLNEEDKAVKAGVIKPFRRGSVMNFQEDAEVLSDDRRWIEKSEDFKFSTGITLCDFEGGQELARGIDAPSRVLLMDASGRLSVRNQLDDTQTVEDHRMTFEAKEDNRRGGRGGRGGEMAPDYGDFGGGEFGF